VADDEIINPKIKWQDVVFILLILFCLLPFVSPPIALAIGIGAALTLGKPFPEYRGKATKILLQVSVVGLGFGMNLGAVVEAGKDGILFTIVTIFGTLALGYLAGKLLRVEVKTSHLISCGTAICGGSAIAAVAPVINADEDQISVSLGTVFILNSIALFIFPLLGAAFHLTQHQFGIWSAIAIHDTSSVVGAAAKYGEEALQVATTVKLARALWIAPIAMLTSWLFAEKSARFYIPLFILFFLLASVVRTYVPLPEAFYGTVVEIAKKGLTVTLFLIGASLSISTIRSVGVKPLIQGVALWIVISVVSLFAILTIL
jgi:uncharacterized integral membrane protein (TIGR00698 family)